MEQTHPQPRNWLSSNVDVPNVRLFHTDHWPVKRKTPMTVAAMRPSRKVPKRETAGRSFSRWLGGLWCFYLDSDPNFLENLFLDIWKIAEWLDNLLNMFWVPMFSSVLEYTGIRKYIGYRRKNLMLFESLTICIGFASGTASTRACRVDQLSSHQTASFKCQFDEMFVSFFFI